MSTLTKTIEMRCGRGAVARSRELQSLAHCHAALSSYGAERLDANGWRTLGIGSLPAASPGFRKLGLDVTTGWATYEAKDASKQTIAQIAARQPHWFDPELRHRITALSASRFDLYSVVDDGTPLTTLKRLRDGARIEVHGFISDEAVTPSGTPLIARLAHDRGLNVLIDSAVASPEAVRAVVGGRRPRDADQWSRRLLDGLLGQFVDADLAARGSSLEPLLLPHSLPALGRLHRALRSLERVLDQRFAPIVRHRTLDGLTLTAERRGRGWRVALNGPHRASVERVPAVVSHPVDVELMRQIGLHTDDGVLSTSGAIDVLAETCARVAVLRAPAVAQ